MSSDNKNHDFETRLHRAKRNRACDACRKRKARCRSFPSSQPLNLSVPSVPRPVWDT
ncbi:hypothetical protein BDM02DRAFT_3117712 [Thelephora ganbajun]|uniref:Uncharacterized protein n=1 Tax=Thelephora ganbajun TaxID=370292 RepID=A0ACB6ZB78_THEGA|nr:hypothetical protein BDM02DRAFT_3117712 [Thelephora ganbajun]